MPYDDCQIKLSFVTSSVFWAVFWRPCSSCVEELTWNIVFVLSFPGVQRRGSLEDLSKLQRKVLKRWQKQSIKNKYYLLLLELTEIHHVCIDTHQSKEMRAELNRLFPG